MRPRSSSSPHRKAARPQGNAAHSAADVLDVDTDAQQHRGRWRTRHASLSSVQAPVTSREEAGACVRGRAVERGSPGASHSGSRSPSATRSCSPVYAGVRESDQGGTEVAPEAVAAQTDALNPPAVAPEWTRKGAGTTPCSNLPKLTFLARQRHAARIAAAAAAHERLQQSGAKGALHSACLQSPPALDLEDSLEALDRARATAGHRQGGSGGNEGSNGGGSDCVPAWMTRDLAAVSREDAHPPSPEEVTRVGFVGLAKRSSAYDGHRGVHPVATGSGAAQRAHKLMAETLLNSSAARAVSKAESNAIWMAEPDTGQAGPGSKIASLNAAEGVKALVRQRAEQESAAFTAFAAGTVDGMRGMFEVRNLGGPAHEWLHSCRMSCQHGDISIDVVSLVMWAASVVCHKIALARHSA